MDFYNPRLPDTAWQPLLANPMESTPSSSAAEAPVATTPFEWIGGEERVRALTEREARRDICTLKDDIFGFGSCFA